MSVHFPTLEEIREKVIIELMGPDSKLDDLQNDYTTKMIIIGASNAVNEQVLAAKAAYEASSILTAVGDDLDAKCIERSPSVRRNTEEQAVNKFLLGKSVASTMEIPIEKGALITTESIGDTPALDFHVKEATILPAGQNTVEVEAFCSVAGEIGNLTPVAKVFPGMTGIEYVKYVEPIVAGADRESDDHLRERLLTEVQNMEKGGTDIDYEIWARRVKGVVSARSIPLARGNGTVDVIITGTVGLPTQ
ncbi:hypothetical protein EEL31_21565 [Brevibacillus laterosporus]|nr:hypothetical protein EEL31_21565 [Brevibacillus laterosporus]